MALTMHRRALGETNGERGREGGREERRGEDVDIVASGEERRAREWEEMEERSKRI